MATVSLAFGLRTLFTVSGTLMLATLLYFFITAGNPFTKELLRPWMLATLIDFYINVVILSAWVVYKEANWVSSLLWIILLVCLGSIATSAYIVVQFLKLSSEESSQDPIYNVLLRRPHKSGTEPKRKHSLVAPLRILFSSLGVVMHGTLAYTLITDGSPFRTELLTPMLESLRFISEWRNPLSCPEEGSYAIVVAKSIHAAAVNSLFTSWICVYAYH